MPVQGHPIPRDPFDEGRSGRFVFFNYDDDKLLGHANQVHGLEVSPDCRLSISGASPELRDWLFERYAKADRLPLLIRDLGDQWYRVERAFIQRYTAGFDGERFEWGAMVTTADEPLY
jgi:hypothetical protein